jgi:hypothetical protein
MVNVVNNKELSCKNTSEIKSEILELVKNRDAEKLNIKIQFYKDELLPYFEELNRRNQYAIAEAQIPLVLGVWTPVWSTIPFHEILPGRIREQSYQIFHQDGFYANIARFAPGHQSSFLQSISSKLPVYDFMIMQKYEAKNGQWQIQNIGIFQALKNREISLTIDEADNWFTNVVNTKIKPNGRKGEFPQTLNLENVDQNTAKKIEKTYLAVPVLEHLYIDNDLRLVKTQREAAQRPSYTIAIRKR